MTLSTISSLGAAFLLLAPPLIAQDHEARTKPTAMAVAESFQTWNDDHGSNWHTYGDLQTGYVQFLFGGQSAAAFVPRGDEDFPALGRLAIENTVALHGIESGTLIEDDFAYLRLSDIGTTDKVTVRFRQEVGGVAVLGGYVNVLFTPQGDLLSIQTTAMPHVAAMSTAAAISGARATEIALASFEESLGLAGGVVRGPTKVIGQLETSVKSREARLVWEVDVQWYGPDMEPEGYTYWIDARDGSVIRSETSIHNFDVGGTISTMATPGTLPDQVNNPEASLPMNHARVNGGASGTVYTDANGNFNFPGVTGPINVTVQYAGYWANVDNQAGSNYSLNTAVNGTGNALLLNPSSSASITAQANAFRGCGVLRDWIRSVDPTDSTADFQAQANVNISSTCNAYFNGNSVNFYQAGGGCPNTAYSTVISHEMGHWLNVLYGTGNGSDGMGEGNADVWAMYNYDTSELAEDFFGVGTGGLRTGWNTLQFCGDTTPGCHGGSVHTEGQVWMGAAWKIRDRLNQTLGNAAGDAVADYLFIAWMNGYNQTQIKSVIETQWLTLDDDDGNIDNGTPNYLDIDGGFRDQGFPGFDLALINFQNVTILPDTTNEAGPYVVDADLLPMVAPTIVGGTLFYRINGGTYISVPMTYQGANSWQAAIPGQASPAVVEYYLEGTDSLGNDDYWPSDAPSAGQIFAVGVVTVLIFDDFEGGDNGWTHGYSATEDDWQRGAPAGQGGDPSSAASGTKCWGNDLGGGGGWDGEYEDDVTNWLRTPVIDCSGAVGTVLRFKRWLGVERGVYDKTELRVNGIVVFENEDGGDHFDNAWVDVEYDISSIVDGDPSVQIEFSLETDYSVTYCGWNIDDFEMTYLGPVVCPPLTSYCTVSPNSVGSGAVMSYGGSASVAANDLVLMASGVPANQFGVFYYGPAQLSLPFGNGVRCVGAGGVGTFRLPVILTDAFGIATWNLDLTNPPGAAGQISSGELWNFQYWFRDPAGGGAQFNLSDGLSATFCP